MIWKESLILLLSEISSKYIRTVHLIQLEESKACQAVQKKGKRVNATIVALHLDGSYLG